MRQGELGSGDGQKRPLGKVTRKWALLLGACTSPLFVVFIYFGHVVKGEAAWAYTMMIALAARLLWRLRDRLWYWITLTVIAALHVPLVMFVRWPFNNQFSYMQLLPLGLLDLAVVYWTIRLVEKMVEGNGSADADTGSATGN